MVEVGPVRGRPSVARVSWSATRISSNCRTRCLHCRSRCSACSWHPARRRSRGARSAWWCLRSPARASSPWGSTASRTASWTRGTRAPERGSCRWWLLPVGALAVTFWVGGFDVFYALQDEAFDRSERLESLVVRLGQARAILAAKLLHGLALVALVLFGVGATLGVAYYVGVGVGAALIAWEHQLVKPGDLSRLNAAFFTANGIVSIVVFLGALVDRIL